MEENKIESVNAEIAKFMGLVYKCDGTNHRVQLFNEDGSPKRRGELVQSEWDLWNPHSDWSAQIPVYSKLAKEIREVAAREKNSILPNLQHAQLVLSYQSPLLDNDPLKGFEIIIENLSWLNKIK